MLVTNAQPAVCAKRTGPTLVPNRARVIGRLREPLLAPNEAERELVSLDKLLRALK